MLGVIVVLLLGTVTHQKSSTILAWTRSPYPLGPPMADEDVAQRVRVETLAWGSSQSPHELLEEGAGCAGVERLSCPAGVNEEVHMLLIFQEVTLQPRPLSAPHAHLLR